MRLLHVIHTVNPASGGTAEAVRNFVLHPGGSTQAVVTLDHSSDPWTKNFASEIFCVGPGRGNYGYLPQFNGWLESNLPGYDAVVIHGCWQYHAFAASRAARKSGIPYFVFPHGMLDPYFKRSSWAKHLKKLAYWPIERRVLAEARAVLFTSSAERDRAHECFRFCSKDEIVPLGIRPPAGNQDAARREFEERFPQLRNKRTILFLGRLHPKKGVELLLRAFTEISDPSLHLLLVGPAISAAYEEELKGLAAKIPGRVTFTGILTGRLKNGAFATAEVLSLPSHQENFGFSVVEALSFGRPVLISNQVNIWQEITQDGAGLAGADTLDGTRETLQKWLTMAPGEREKMGAAAKVCFERRYRAEAASGHFLSVLQKRGILNNEQHRGELLPA